MKARIMDADALRAISPVALAAFARNLGWTKTEAYGAHADVYALSNEPEVILPRTDRLADYASTVSRLTEIFARVKGSDELAIYRDLVAADRDVVRVRAIGADDDGSVALDEGVEIVIHARDMLLAAACAVKIPQPFYRAGANKEAVEYMRRVKLGQTEHGSFVVTLLAPVPPLLQPQLDLSWENLADEPMERLVTRRLIGSLEASRNAAEMALSGESEAFANAVSFGVSANLCDAVASLIEQAQGIDISVTWALTRPAPETKTKVSFSENDAEILREAARTFKLRQPKEGVKLFGTISKLKREHSETEGVVTIKALVEDQLQSVNSILDGVSYDIAVKAHGEKRPVLMTGDLARKGQRWELTNPSIIELAPDDTADED